MRLNGISRQVYVDLVRARSRVRIVPASAKPTQEPPIFVVGVYRSGTTLLRYVLDSHPRIACPPETDFMHRFAGVLDDPSALAGLESLGFDRAHVVREVASLCAYFFDNYALSAGKARWADKTPRYVDHLPLLEELFPQACRVVIHRHPLDQIHSHTKGGTFVHRPLVDRCQPDVDVRVVAAHYWVEQTQKILAACERRPPAFVIGYERLCLEPRKTIAGLLAAIGEPWSDAVLDFQEQSHDVGKEAASIQRHNGFELQTGGYRAWDARVVHECTEIVTETARRVGYDVRPA
jgi:hypothetical protein